MDDIVRALEGSGPKGPNPGVPAYRTQVFVPAHPRPPRDGEPPVIGLELMTGADGEPVSVAFTSLEKLVAALGPAQPWVGALLGTFTEMMTRAGLSPVLLDPAVPPGAGRWRPSDLEELAGKAESA